jgi:hypothetical protein
MCHSGLGMSSSSQPILSAIDNFSDRTINDAPDCANRWRDALSCQLLIAADICRDYIEKYQQIRRGK